MVPAIAEKKNNTLPLWGNEKTMNLNNLILTNILSSHYFKVNLYQLKTYHEVIDEIYFQVTHLEPWEKGSRKTSGQTGMCGGVRGVGAGGIVSTAFCILYKLFTLKLTRKQLVGLINHADSPYIRALGFMYIRYTQPPSDLWDWYEFYLTDEEELDVKAGGGQTMQIGEMLRYFLSKLEWYSTLFPRIPVPIQKDLEMKLSSWRGQFNSKSLDTSEQLEDSESLSVKEAWSDGASNHRSSQESRTYVEDSRDKAHVAKESAREKDRHKRERAASSPSHHNHKTHHKSSHRSSHRSRSPLPRKDDEKHSSKKHRDGDSSMERRYHKSHNGSRHKDNPERELERKHTKDRTSNHDRRKEKHHSKTHSHNYSKHHEKRSHLREH